jgi:hypothetical protein
MRSTPVLTTKHRRAGIAPISWQSVDQNLLQTAYFSVRYTEVILLTVGAS